VLAVEPNPAVAQVLDRTTPASVRVLQAAAGDVPGRTTLWVPASGRGSEGVAGLQEQQGFSPVEVDRVRLDDALEGGPRPPAEGEVALVKVDVEGFELEVLRGAERTLVRHRPVVVVELEHHRSDVGAAVAYLRSLGYDPEVLVEGRWTPLAEFDLAAHQARLQPLVGERSLLHRIARPAPRYVNNVVFRPRP
jgi:FkbM family methyltransferase